MKRLVIIVLAIIGLSLTGCGGGHDNSPPLFSTQILSDASIDGDIEQTSANSYNVTQGMSPTVQSVFAGIDPITLNEYRAFLHFPLSGRVPANAIIDSAFIEIYIKNIYPPTGIIPIRIELVDFQPPILYAADFDRSQLLPLQYTTIYPPISSADVGRIVRVDVTELMIEAQVRGLLAFQIRILEDLGIVYPGLIEINDSTQAPLLHVTYF